VADAALNLARPVNPAAPPVGWQQIPDLTAIIRARAGAPPHTQALLLRWLLDHGAATGPIAVPPMATVARDIDCSRQSTNQAWHTLQRRGIVAATPFEGDRGWTEVTVTLPVHQQLSMFRSAK